MMIITEQQSKMNPPIKSLTSLDQSFRNNLQDEPIIRNTANDEERLPTLQHDNAHQRHYALTNATAKKRNGPPSIFDDRV